MVPVRRPPAEDHTEEGITVRPHGASDRSTTENRGGGATEWTSFTVGIPRWLLAACLRGRHPLVRATDRIESAVFVLAVIVALLSLPIAGAVGTGAYDSLRHSYAEQVASRHRTEATVAGVASQDDFGPTNRVSVPVTWFGSGVEHTGTAMAADTVHAGDSVQVWVDKTGAQVPAPGDDTRAAAEAVTLGVLLWAGVVAAAAAVFVGIRGLCNRVRRSQWDKDLGELVEHGDGPARQGP